MKCFLLLLSFTFVMNAQAGSYDQGEAEMQRWQQQKEMDNLRNQQRMESEQRRIELDNLQREQRRLEENAQRDRMIRSGQGRSPSLADEVYR